MITLILARAENGVIGRDGKLPWHIPADLKRFKALTMSKPMIMGRKTFESFPAPLPGRRHIVLTRDAGWSADGAEVVHSVDEALARAGDDAWVIGGAQIFELFRDIADRAEATTVWRRYEGDTMFDFDQADDWEVAAREDHPAEGDRPAFTFFTLARPRSGASPERPYSALMQRLDGGSALPAPLRGGIVALGNFDGFHAGHQAVVGRAVERARAQGRPALVATFDPHPMRYFRPDSPWFRLTTLDQREALLKAAGVDEMLVFDFDAALAALSAYDFVAKRLIDGIGAAGVVTGEDFTFGEGRSGSVTLLAELGRRNGFAVDTVAPVALDGETVSSTRIRAALKAGDPRTAARLLTRPFAVRGTVQHGDKVGRTIGYPTANIDLGNYVRPAYGIYAVRGVLADGRVLDGAANLGIRPTFDPPKELLEPYFFDVDEDLYGQEIEVSLIDYLRPEAKFASLAALTAQMDADCAKARAILSGTHL